MKRVRCAIYTRKSSDEGLDQNFNSLDAQREACEAYVRSQKHEGWKALPARYDDGDASGGNMDRKALQILLSEIDQGRVDMVVVYKIDRLTRSLADFAKLVDRLDAAGASFVSVTQQFNTSTSMGRLTLNVLLSFAQFEREVTAERIRDKIAASKKKGLWMGGLVPLGYDKTDDGLVINKVEAQIVRTLFEAYLVRGSVRALKQFADASGFRTKTRTLKSGRIIEGKSFSRGRLYHLLSNQIYIGKIRHKDKLYDGVHDAIIDEAIWTRVQARLSQNAVDRKSGKNAANPSPLAGKVFDENGSPLTPSHANKAGRRYRYYVSKDGQVRLAASELEHAVREALGANRELQLHFQRHQKASPNSNLIVARVTLHGSKISIALKEGLEPKRIESDFVRRRRGVENKLVLETGSMRKPDKFLIRRVLKAMKWLDQIKLGQGISDIAASENVSPEYITHNLGLGLLSPGILRAIASGSQRADISAYQLSKMTIPVDWSAQNSIVLEQNQLP
ncbi:MAG: recombinase family protein [Pseudomonadota bacterium]